MILIRQTWTIRKMEEVPENNVFDEDDGGIDDDEFEEDEDLSEDNDFAQVIIRSRLPFLHKDYT
jgi:hypothetical protein